MPSATVVVEFVNEATEGKKSGSIKTKDGEYYGVLKAMLPQFAKGGTYNVEYTTRSWQGKTYKDVASVTQVSAPAPQSGGGSKYGATDDVTAERIFVCGALNSAIQAGQINVADGPTMVQFVTTLRTVWKRTFGTATQPPAQLPTIKPPAPPAQGQQHSDDMEDSVPF